MAWTTIRINTPEELKDAIVGEFSADGILGVWERPTSEPRSVELILYFDRASAPPLVKARAGRVFERNGHAIPEVKLGTQPEEDWIREWRKSYASFSVGRRFQVVPSWEASGDPGGDRIVLEIDPGLAFGTGTHETTRLMLEALERTGTGGGHVFDLGTGSGILAIAAQKLGLKVEAACDLDPDAVRVAKDNLQRNSVTIPVFVGSVNAVRSASIALLLANLTSEAVSSLLGEVGRVLVPQGRALFSGILESQEESFRAAVEAEGFRMTRETRQGEWIAAEVARDGR